VFDASVTWLGHFFQIGRHTRSGGSVDWGVEVVGCGGRQWDAVGCNGRMKEG
jgi:hypothetical protein